MSIIKLTLPIEVLPKAKPRFRRYERPVEGRTGHFYSPSAKLEYEIALLAADQMRRKGYRIIEGNAVVSANFFYKRKKVPGDLDHILSTLLDGLKSVLVRDDKYIIGFERIFAIPDSGQDVVVLEVREAKDLWEEVK